MYTEIQLHRKHSKNMPSNPILWSKVPTTMALMSAYKPTLE